MPPTAVTCRRVSNSSGPKTAGARCTSRQGRSRPVSATPDASKLTLEIADLMSPNWATVRSMALADITYDSVLRAVAEHDRLGDEAFRSIYGPGPARRYVLTIDGHTYDSDAIAGVAHQYVTGTPLQASKFSGGQATVVARLRSLGFDVRDHRAAPTPTRVFGEIAGIHEGTVFARRADAYAAGVHRANQAGIVGTGRDGAESIVVSGGYEDDDDRGTEIIYTGHGGRGPNGTQDADQTFDAPGNAALRTSRWTGKPVRVLRGPHRGSPYAPKPGTAMTDYSESKTPGSPAATVALPYADTASSKSTQNPCQSNRRMSHSSRPLLLTETAVLAEGPAPYNG